MVYGISVSDDYLNKDRNHYHTPVMDNSTVDKYSYLGMSVAGAHFFGNNWTYVAGAPKAAMGSGQVIFFTKVRILHKYVCIKRTACYLFFRYLQAMLLNQGAIKFT